MGVQEKIKEIEEEMARTQKNKATEFHLGLLKAKLAQLRRQLIAGPKGGASAGGFDVKKSGDATVALIGLPSVGKSTLLNKLTNAESQTAAYAFTTLTCIPGILNYKGARIQILDLPGIIEGAKDGRGRGREVIAVARNANLILLIIEAGHPEQLKVLTKELEGFGIRLNRKKPDIAVSKTERGGVFVNSTVKLTKITEREIKAVLDQYSIYSANVILRNDVGIDDLIDVLEGNRVYLKSFVCVNKIDTITPEQRKKLPKEYVGISAQSGVNLDGLKDAVYDKLDLIHVYTKRRGETADLEEPLIIRKGVTVAEVCDALHRDLRKEFRFALVWGKSVKHQGQRVGLAHILADKDVIQIVKR